LIRALLPRKRPPQQRLKQMLRLAQGFFLLGTYFPISTGQRLKLVLKLHWRAGNSESFDLVEIQAWFGLPVLE